MVVKDDDPRGAGWSDPAATGAPYCPGLSPYLHYYRTTGKAPPSPDRDPGKDASPASQLEETLRDLIERSFG